MKQYDFDKLRRFSADIRIWTAYEIANAGSGHIGGSASIADVLAVLYGGVMNIKPSAPDWEDRDRFVLSKGHCAPALYAALALKKYFPMEWLKTLNKGGTNLPSHADRLHVPGVDMSTGSLGQGISAAVGIALANRLLGRASRTYCIVGDGECNEGQLWEACETAAHFALDRFFLFVDWNKKQLDGTLEEICRPFDFEAKFTSFGFDVKTVRGYDVESIARGIEESGTVPHKPHCIILDTLKGIGIKTAEEQEFNHHMSMSYDDFERSAAEIERRLANGTYPGGSI